MNANNEVAVEEVEDPIVAHCARCHEGLTEDQADRRSAVNARSSTTSNITSVQWCEDCVGSHSYQCNDCEELFSSRTQSSYSNTNDNTICRSCYENNYVTCADCDTTISRGDATNRRGYYYCEGCGDNNDEGGSAFDRHYDAKQALGMFGDPSDGLYFGIELETEAARGKRGTAVDQIDAAIGEFAIQKDDGSLQNGIEIVSAPASFEYHQTAWNPFFADIPEGLTSWKSGRCGIHIHVSRQPLAVLTIGKIVVFINSPSNKELVKAVAGRYYVDGGYSGNGENSYAVIKRKTLESFYEDRAEKYEAVNLCHSATIEFRIFRGTLCKTSFFKNLEFVHAVVKFCEDTPQTKLDQSDFIEWLMKNNTKYPNLIAFLLQKKLINSCSYAEAVATPLFPVSYEAHMAAVAEYQFANI